MHSPLPRDVIVVPQAQPGAALSELFAQTYRELHRLARHQLQRGPTSTLGATTLLHEAYLRLAGKTSLNFADRPQFLAYVSRVMRSTLIDHSRRRRALKSPRSHTISLTDNSELEPAIEASACLLYDTLQTIEKLDHSLATLIDRHIFGGLSLAEIADAQNVSERSIQRQWRRARLLLEHVLQERASTSPAQCALAQPALRR